jgi:hypothetical protein
MAEALQEISESDNCPKCSFKLPPRFSTGRVVCSKCGWSNQPKGNSAPSWTCRNEKCGRRVTGSVTLCPYCRTDKKPLDKASLISGYGCLALSMFLVSWLFYSCVNSLSNTLKQSPTQTSPAAITIKASSRICVDNFNRMMSPGAIANLDKDTKTMNIAFADGMTQQEFSQLSQSTASTIFSSCSDIFIKAVKIYSNGYSVRINRP